MADLFKKITTQVKNGAAAARSEASNKPRQDTQRQTGTSERKNDRPANVSELATTLTGWFQPATSGPATVQTTSTSSPSVQPIRTPELDKATGNGWEDTQALGRELTPRMSASQILARNMSAAPEDVTPQMQAEYQKAAQAEREYKTRRRNARQGMNASGPLAETANPDNWTGDAAMYLQMGGDVDRATVRGLDNLQRRYLGDMAGGVRNVINEAGYIAQGSMGGMQNDPTLSGDAAMYMQTFGDSIPEVKDLKRITNLGQGFQDKTQELYGDMTGGWKVAGDVAGTIGQQTPAMALNFIPGAGQALSSAYLFGSAAGAATEQAIADGATPEEAMQYGIASGAVEAATERLFDGMAGLLGKGAADDVVEKVIGKMTARSGSNALRNALRLGFGAAGEGAEEGISALVDPILRSIYNNQTIRENYQDIDWEDVLYNIELGVISGGLFGTLGMANGQYKGKNAALNQQVVTEVVNDVLTNTPEGQAVAARAQEAASAENPLTQAILANEQGEQEQGNEFNAPQSPQGAEQVQSNIPAPTAQTTAQSEAQARVTEILSGAMSNSRAESIINDPELRTAFEEMSGEQLTGSKSEQRAAVKEYAAQMETTSQEETTAPVQEMPMPEAQPATPTSPIAQTVLNNEQQTAQTQPEAPAQPAPQPGQLRSQSEANTIQTVDEQQGAPEDVRQELYYTPVGEEESVAQARAMLENGYEGGVPGRPNTKLTPEQSEALTAAGERLGGGYGQAIADMQGAPVWTAVQQDMSLLMFNALAEDAKRTGDWSAYLAWRIVDQEHATEIARALQARGKATRGETQDIMDYVADTINSSNMSQSAKDAAMAKTMQFAEEYTNTDKADADALRDLIVRMSDERKTGTVFKKNLEKLLNGQDAEYLAKIAEAQVKGMANDYIPASVGDKVKSWQTIAQLLKITTFARNLGGNETFGFMDALVGNTFGVALDKMVGGTTGARSVGFDSRWFSSTQRKAAVDAMQKSMLEIALDVDMGSVGTKYDPRGRSFRMNGNPAERFASRLSQILSYSLTSSDAFFRGALEAGTTETLNRLNAGNEAALSQVEGVAQNRANYALFQNQGKTAQTAKAFHDRLNAWIGTGGKVENGRRTGGFGLGDLIMPYATVPANLAIKPFEYSPLGIVKGGIELAKVLKNAQSGNVNLQAQHNAVMEIARGVTGLPVALLLSQLIRSGIVKRSDDDDDYDVTKARQSENRRETQWNLDATLRWLQGGSREWEEGDKLISLNWMEPLNAFMDIGALIADMQEDEDPALTDYLSKYAIGSVQAAMEMPMIDGLQSAIQAMQYADSDNMWEKLGKFGESTITSAATGMMPGAVSQLARTLDPTTRDTSADTFAGRFANALMNATPGLRTQLPEKLDSLGNPITNDNPLLNALNNFILPGQVAEYAPNDVVQALDEVYEATGKSNFYPDYKPPASFSYDDADYKLDTEEKRLYQQTFGNTYEELVRNVTQSAEYDSLTAAEKAAVFSEMRSMATAEAKGAIVEGRGGEYTSDYDKVSELSDIPGYFSTKAMFSTASNEKNRDYERMPEILDAYGSLPDDVKEKLKAGNTSSMDELYDAWKGGVSAENWYKAYDAKADLVPFGDHKNVAEWQKYQAMANVSTDEDMDIMLRGYMQDSAYESYMTARNDGLSAKDWADARAAAGMLKPPEGKENVPDALQYQAYATVLDDKGMDAMMHATLEEGSYDKYVAARDAGISAENWANAMASTVGLVPLEGHKDVTDAQKWQAMAGTVSDRDMDALMRANLSEGSLRDYTAARNAGITPQQWADTCVAVAQLPVLDGNKAVANWQKVNYVGGSNMTDAQKDALMILYFDKGEGNKVATYDKYMLCRDAGFAPVHIAKFYEIMQTAQGVDKDGDGKTDSGTKKKAILAAAMAYGFNEKNAERLYNMWQNGHW